MADLSSSDAFVKALDSAKIVLLVGGKQIGSRFERMSISKDSTWDLTPNLDILFKKSPYIAELVGKSEDNTTLDMGEESVAVVKMFIQWCYRESLPPPQPNSTPDQQRRWKNALIDIWIFAGRYRIVTLQNEAMGQLVHLLDNFTLFPVADVRYIWDRTQDLTYELRTLATFLLVAKIQDSKDDTKPEQLDKFSKLDDFVSDIYSATVEWTKFQPPASPRKDKRSKWLKFTEKGDIKHLLMAEERIEIRDTPSPPPRCAPAKVTKNEAETFTPVKQEAAAPLVRIKKEPEQEGRRPFPTPSNSQDVEMIDLTEDD